MRLTDPPRSQYVGRWRRWYKKEEEEVGLDTTPQTDGLADKILGGGKIDGYIFWVIFPRGGRLLNVRTHATWSVQIHFPFMPRLLFPNAHSPN